MRNKPLKGIYNKPLQGNIIKKVGDAIGMDKVVNFTDTAGKLGFKVIGKVGDAVKSSITKGFKSYVGTKGINLTSLPSNLHLHKHAGGVTREQAIEMQKNKPQQKKGGKFFKKIKGKIKDATELISDRISEVKEDIKENKEINQENSVYNQNVQNYITQNKDLVESYKPTGITADQLYELNVQPGDTAVTWQGGFGQYSDLNRRNAALHLSGVGGQLSTLSDDQLNIAKYGKMPYGKSFRKEQFIDPSTPGRGGISNVSAESKKDLTIIGQLLGGNKPNKRKTKK